MSNVNDLHIKQATDILGFICKQGYLNFIPTMMQQGADPYCPIGYKYVPEYPIIISAEHGHWRIVEVFLNQANRKHKNILEKLLEYCTKGEQYKIAARILSILDSRQAVSSNEKDKSEANEKNMCAICKENERNIICLPCAHVCMCTRCSEKLADNKCPICKTKLKEVKRIYMS